MSGADSLRFVGNSIIPINSKMPEDIPMKDAVIHENESHEFHDADLRDATYFVFSSDRRHIRIKISDRGLSLLCEDYGEDCRRINGKDEYEFAYQMDKVQTEQLIRQLRKKHGANLAMQEIFIKEFGFDDGTLKFDHLCETHGLKYHFFSY